MQINLANLIKPRIQKGRIDTLISNDEELNKETNKLSEFVDVYK